MVKLAVRDDAADPDFAHMLKTVGAVQIPDSARSYDLGAVVRPPRPLSTLNPNLH